MVETRRKTKEKQMLVKSAPPPAQTVALVVAIAAVCLAVLPSFDEVKAEATLEALGSSPFFSNQTLLWIRIACILIFSSVPISWALSPERPEDTTYLPGSKLKNGEVPISGISGNMIFFTNWCFMLLIFSLAGMAAASFALDNDTIELSPTFRALTLLR